MTQRPVALERWHQLVSSRDTSLLADLLDADCVFRSPAVYAPQEGQALTSAYLSAAIVVLGPTLEYQHEWWDDDSAVLEFTAVVGEKSVHGIDMLRWGPDGRLTEVSVMVRPFSALTALMEQMVAELGRQAG